MGQSDNGVLYWSQDSAESARREWKERYLLSPLMEEESFHRAQMMKIWEKLKQQIGQQSQISSKTKLRKITSHLRQNLSLPTLSRDTQIIKDSFSGIASRLFFSTNMDALVMSMGETSSLNVHERKAIRGQVESENIGWALLVTGKAHPRDEL